MKPNLWLEFPCNQYKGCYGIKVWESGGSWSPPSSWYEKGDKLIKQSGGVVCLPCVAAVNPASVTAALGAIGLTAVKVAKSNKKKTKKSKRKTKKII